MIKIYGLIILRYLLYGMMLTFPLLIGLAIASIGVDVDTKTVTNGFYIAGGSVFGGIFCIVCAIAILEIEEYRSKQIKALEEKLKLEATTTPDEVQALRNWRS